MLFILLFAFGSIWLSTFGACVVSLYKSGKMLWEGGGNAVRPTQQDFFIILVISLVVFITIGSNIISDKILNKAKGNILLALLLSLLISIISTVPFVIVVWVTVLFYT